MQRMLVALAVLSLVLVAPDARAFEKGRSMFALEFTDGTADLADRAGSSSLGYIGAYSLPEIGTQAQYWRFLSEDYAMTVSGGIGFSSQTAKPGNTVPLPGGDIQRTTSSFNLRLGGDRVVKVGSRAIMYGGPGIEFWGGKAKYEGPTSASDYEGERTRRFGVSARIGGVMMLGRTLGLSAHVGHRFGYASAEEDGAKTTWWPSSFDGSMGFIFIGGGVE